MTTRSAVAAESRRRIGSPTVLSEAELAFVYVLRCRDGTLYCGWTTDLDRRVGQHRAGTASRYTRSRLPLELVWSTRVGSRSEAMREEARIKRLPRAEKLELIRVPQVATAL